MSVRQPGIVTVPNFLTLCGACVKVVTNFTYMAPWMRNWVAKLYFLYF